ncbi:MAG: 1-acyl-sn-glycerol-3-phosphate acyltransferase [Lactobacillus sp.]|nr:1-acyl-sn-glycerol-3-phosphate acyltransferase [Lactobacillus sp.]
MGKRKYFYHHLTDDLVVSLNQDYQLPNSYAIFPKSLGGKIWSKIVHPLGHLISIVYINLILRVRIVGKEKLQAINDQGYFIYGNHTQTFGDVVLPLSIIPAKNYYAIAAQSNWGIPVLGKLVLPYFGLPVGQNIEQSAKLIKAITAVIKAKKVVVIYPESHVWPYYTKIRPFPATSMHFPVMLAAPSFAMTTTYSKPKRGTKPRMTVYIDGPFYPDTNLNKKQAQKKLHSQIYQAMQKRALLSDYEYCTYQKIN